MKGTLTMKNIVIKNNDGSVSKSKSSFMNSLAEWCDYLDEISKFCDDHNPELIEYVQDILVKKYGDQDVLDQDDCDYFSEKIRDWLDCDKIEYIYVSIRAVEGTADLEYWFSIEADEIFYEDVKDRVNYISSEGWQECIKYIQDVGNEKHICEMRAVLSDLDNALTAVIKEQGHLEGKGRYKRSYSVDQAYDHVIEHNYKASYDLDEAMESILFDIVEKQWLRDLQYYEALEKEAA